MFCTSPPAVAAARRYARISVDFPVLVYRGGGSACRSYARNLSRAGMMLRGRHGLTRGERLDLTFTLAERRFAVAATVVWVSASRIGVEFDAALDSAIELLLN